MRLLVIRHAIAMDRLDYQAQELRKHSKILEGDKQNSESGKVNDSSEASDASDDFRPLTVEGIRKMHKKAKGLKKIVDRPLLLVSSPLTRARQTAEILSDAWKGLEPIVCDALRPESDPSEFSTWLKAQPEASNKDALIAIVGHNPHLPSLLAWFLAGTSRSFIDLKKGNSCLLEFRASANKNKATLLWLNK